MKTLIIYISLAVVTFVLNFAIYNFSFNLQATPFLHEEQRVDSGLLMLKTTFPAYLVSSVVIALLFYIVNKRLNSKA